MYFTLLNLKVYNLDLAHVVIHYNNAICIDLCSIMELIEGFFLLGWCVSIVHIQWQWIWICL